MKAARTLSDDPAQAPAPVVLVVEDEVLIRLAVSAYLRECGFQVIEAGSADEAVGILQADIKVDVVFSDVNMPGDLDGFALSQWIGRQRPLLKVVLTSGVTRTAQEARDLCEHDPILAKPYHHAELERHIRELLAR